MHFILLKACTILLITQAHKMQAAPIDHVYSAWTDTGIHLMVSDNGTPEDFTDDYIVDWETNRDFIIKVYD